MSTTIIILLCILILIAYVFDITSSKTKIPTVILLLALGWGLKQFTVFFGFELPNITMILPIVGTFGLILIVLEGSIDLEINNNKTKIIRQSIFMAIIPFLLFSAALAIVLMEYANTPLRSALINAIPLGIISSAIAIPSARNFKKHDQEFIIYESSFSDILGVISFNFLLINETINLNAFGTFGLQLVIILFISIIATLGLAYLLNKINHKIKFIPIIILIVLIYSISKLFHLPSLIFILIFGLTLANIEILKTKSWLKRFNLKRLSSETTKFKEILSEGTFLVRISFFIIFGFLIELDDLKNLDSLFWSIPISLGIYFIRFVFLAMIKKRNATILFNAPRGLITILLFVTIDNQNQIEYINNSLITQVIIITSVLLIFSQFQSKEHTPAEVVEETIGE
jgi:cell volume regulation protein A